MSHVPASHRLEHRSSRISSFYDGCDQPDQRSPTRDVYLRAAWYRGILAAAPLMGQAAARLAENNPASALGWSYHLWTVGTAAGRVGAGIRHLGGGRR